jgi:hypothetical protein
MNRPWGIFEDLKCDSHSNEGQFPFRSGKNQSKDADICRTADQSAAGFQSSSISTSSAFPKCPVNKTSTYV